MKQKRSVLEKFMKQEIQCSKNKNTGETNKVPFNTSYFMVRN